MGMSNSLTPVAGQAPASNTDATVTLAAPTTGRRWVLYGVTYSYTAAPTGGQLIITCGSITETYHVTAAGIGNVVFAVPKRFPPDTALTVTLKAGGVGISGTVYPLAEVG